MYLLKKLFQLREKANHDEEKPFLEHLEELRIVVTRVVLTLLISTLVCFTYREQLMEILRRPVDSVWLASQQERMPEGDLHVDSEDWEAAKKLADTIGHRPPELRRAFYAAYNNPVQERLAGLVDDYRAALLVPDTQREAFIDALATAAHPENRLGKEDVALLKSLVSKDHQPEPASIHGGDPRQMSALTPAEGFMLSMKLAFFAGIVISFPLLLYFILLFILPGLKQEEKRVLWPALAVAFLLFIGGVLFAYFLILPNTLKFFYDFSREMGVSNDWRIGFYISFATQFTLLFGLAFELPVVVMAIVKLGLLRYETMRSTRAYAVLAITVAAAVITPTPDAVTLLLMAAPMYILYECCIIMAWWLDRRDRRTEAQLEAQRYEELKQRLAAGAGAATAHADEPEMLDYSHLSDRDEHETFVYPEDLDELDNPEQHFGHLATDAHGNYGISPDDEEGADEADQPDAATKPEDDNPHNHPEPPR